MLNSNHQSCNLNRICCRKSLCDQRPSYIPLNGHAEAVPMYDTRVQIKRWEKSSFQNESNCYCMIWTADLLVRLVEQLNHTLSSNTIEPQHHTLNSHWAVRRAYDILWMSCVFHEYTIHEPRIYATSIASNQNILVSKNVGKKSKTPLYMKYRCHLGPKGPSDRGRKKFAQFLAVNQIVEGDFCNPYLALVTGKCPESLLVHGLVVVTSSTILTIAPNSYKIS